MSKAKIDGTVFTIDASGLNIRIIEQEPGLFTIEHNGEMTVDDGIIYIEAKSGVPS